MLGDDGRRGDHAHKHVRLRHGGLEDDRVIIGRRHRLEIVQWPSQHEHRVDRIDLEQPAVREDHVFGCERLSVRPLHSLADVERPRQTVLGETSVLLGRDLCRELRPQVEALGLKAEQEAVLQPQQLEVGGVVAEEGVDCVDVGRVTDPEGHLPRPGGAGVIRLGIGDGHTQLKRNGEKREGKNDRHAEPGPTAERLASEASAPSAIARSDHAVPLRT